MRKTPTNLERLDSALKTLGKKTAEEIAALMLKLGIKGEARCSQKCVIAKYLKRRGVRNLDVTAFSSWVGDSHDFRRKNPPSVVQFIRRFDAGEFPLLVLPQEWEVACAA